MTSSAPHDGASTHRAGRRWLAVAAALVLVGTGCLAVGLTGHRHPLAPPVTRHPAPGAVAVAPRRAQPVAPVTARSVPVSLRIPAIGVSVTLSSLGLQATGTVAVPTDYQQPGWYQLGPSPGEKGSAVILGHVDTYLGPAVFFRLRTLVAGDAVTVTLRDGVVANFTVDSVTQYAKAQFPDEEVYGTHGDAALQLVTCGGTFDATTHQYLSNVVVYTTLAATTAPGAGAATAPTAPAPTALTGTPGAAPGASAA